MMENKTQRKRGKNKNQNEASFYHHTQIDSNNTNNNHLYPVSTDNATYSSPPRSSRNRYNNNARNQMNYTQSHPHPNDNAPNNMHINAQNQNNNSHHNNHNHRQYNRGDTAYYRSNRNDSHSHPRYQSHPPHNQSKYQYNTQKPRNSQYSHYQNHHVYPRNSNNNHSHSHNHTPIHSHAHSNANTPNNGNTSNHNAQRARFSNNSARKHQDDYVSHQAHSNQAHSNPHINHSMHIHNKHQHHHHHHGPRSATPHNQQHNQHINHSHHMSHRLASQSTSALMCNIADHSPASVLSSPSATYYDFDDKSKENDGSHKYHRFEDQNYQLNATQITKIVQILGQKHEIHDKLKSSQHKRDFSTILARFLLSLLQRLEECGVDGFCVDAILLGGGAAAYVLDEHSKPNHIKSNDDNSNNNIKSTDDAEPDEQKFPPLHYNDVDIMLEIDFEEWHEESLPFRNEKEHHIAVYAAIRTAFLECLREFAPKDMQNMDIEDICSAYIDTQKRFLCGNEDSNGGNSDCWAIYSGNHDCGHYLDLVFIHKMKRRYTFSTDSFRIKISKPALQFISECIKQHDRQYKQQQFRKKLRKRSMSYPSLAVLKNKRIELDKERKHKRMRNKELEEIKNGEEEDEEEQQQQQEEHQDMLPMRCALPLQGPMRLPFPFIPTPNMHQLQFGAPLQSQAPPHPFCGYPLPPRTLRAVINWYELAEKLSQEQIQFNAYALCGDFTKARDNLQKRNIGKVANPEKIHGGGFFKYCDLISKQWKRSEKLEKLLWIRLSWDIDINRGYDRKQGNNETVDVYTENGDRYNYMNDLKDIDRTLATYIRRHYKNRAHHVNKFLNWLEIVIKDLRQDDAALEVLSDNIRGLRDKLKRHLHEEQLHEMNNITKHKHKSPPIIHQHRNVIPHTLHNIPPPNATNSVFPPLPNGAPVMTPNGVLINQHFTHLMHHGKQIQSMRTMFTQPPNANAPPHRPPFLYPTPNPVPYLRANRPQQTQTNTPSNSTTNRPLHQNLQEYQQRYNNNEWVSLYTGHAHSHPRKAYHIAPSLVNLNLTKAPPEQTTNIGNIINSYIPPYIPDNHNDEEEERDNIEGDNDDDSISQEKDQLELSTPQTPSLLPQKDEDIQTKRRNKNNEEQLPATPSSIDSDDPLDINDININHIMTANLNIINDKNSDNAEHNDDDENIINILQDIDIATDKEEIHSSDNDNDNETDGNEGNDDDDDDDNNDDDDDGSNETNDEGDGEEDVSNTVSVLPPIQPHPLPNQISPHQIKLVAAPPTFPGYPRFFQVNGQTYQFPVANYYVIVPNNPLSTHNQRRPVFIPNKLSGIHYLNNKNNNDDEDNIVKNDDSASPPPPSGSTQSFNKGVVYQQQIEGALNSSSQKTQSSPPLLPIHNQLHFHPSMIPQQRPPPPPPPPPSHILRQYNHIPHQASPFLIHQHLLSQQQQQQQSVVQTLSSNDNASKDSFAPPQKNNSERFRRPENMNDSNLNNVPSSSNNDNDKSNNDKNRQRQRQYSHLPPNHSYFYSNNQNNARNNSNNNNNNCNSNNNSNYRNNNIHYNNYSKRAYNSNR